MTEERTDVRRLNSDNIEYTTKNKFFIYEN